MAGAATVPSGDAVSSHILEKHSVDMRLVVYHYLLWIYIKIHNSFIIFVSLRKLVSKMYSFYAMSHRWANI